MSDIHAAAEGVANAQATANDAERHLADRLAARDRLRGRMNDLEAERAAIVADRAAGNVKTDDASRLTLIGADIEGIKNLIAPLESEASAALAGADQARGVLRMAEEALARSRDCELLGRLVKHATVLDGLLLTTVSDISRLARGLGHSRNQWEPTAELSLEIRRLELQKITGVPR